MSSISRRSGNKNAIQRTIVAAFLANRLMLEKRLGQQIFPEGVPDEVDIGVFVDGLVKILIRDAKAFEAIDQLVADETSEDRALREKRNELVGLLRQTLFNIRSFVEGVWGDAVARQVGFIGSTPENPDQLLTYARNVDRKLVTGLDGFETLLKVDPPNITPYAEALQGQIEKLDAIVDNLEIDIKETQDAQNERNRVGDDWNKHYAPVASIMENLFRLAEMPAHAERVRPTSRRRAGLPEDDDLKDIEELEDELDVDVVDADSKEEDVVTT